LLLEPFDRQEFGELKARVEAQQVRMDHWRRDERKLSDYEITDVFMGEMPFTVRSREKNTALFEAPRANDRPFSCREDEAPRHSRRTPARARSSRERTCTLLFYQRRVFAERGEMCAGGKPCEVVPMYGLRAADAFALQYNWNRDTEREDCDGSTVRARLLHNLDDACDRRARPKHAFLVDVDVPSGYRSCAETLAGAHKRSEELSFREIASAVLLFEQCPVVLGATVRAPSTVTPTCTDALKALAVATGNDCDPGHTDSTQEILVDFDVFLGANNNINLGDLCRQLSQHHLWDGDLYTMLAKAAKPPRGGRKAAAAEFWRTAPYVEKLTQATVDQFAYLPLHLLRELRLRTFDVTQDVPHLCSLLDHAMHASKVHKRYRYKSRKYEKDTEKAVGKALLVQAGHCDWTDFAYNLPWGSVGQCSHQGRKPIKRGKHKDARRRKLCRRNYLLDQGGAFGTRPRTHPATWHAAAPADSCDSPDSDDCTALVRTQAFRAHSSGESGRLTEGDEDDWRKDEDEEGWRKDEDEEGWRKDEDEDEEDGWREAEEARCFDIVRAYEIERDEWEREKWEREEWQRLSKGQGEGQHKGQHKGQDEGHDKGQDEGQDEGKGDTLTDCAACAAAATPVVACNGDDDGGDDDAPIFGTGPSSGPCSGPSSSMPSSSMPGSRPGDGLSGLGGELVDGRVEGSGADGGRTEAVVTGAWMDAQPVPATLWVQAAADCFREEVAVPEPALSTAGRFFRWFAS
jgi:hypothetical protein